MNEAQQQAPLQAPDPRGPLSLEAPLVRLVERLGGGKSMAEMVRAARWRRRKKEKKQ